MAAEFAKSAPVATVRAAAKKYVASSQYILGELRPASSGK